MTLHPFSRLRTLMDARRPRNLPAAHGPLLAALGLLPLLAGCFYDLKQSTVHPETDTGRVIQHVYAMVTWIDTGIFIVVLALLLWTVIRYRERPGQQGLPEQVHGNAYLELVWTIVPAIILVFIAVPTWSGIFRADRPPEAKSLTVVAMGHQWFWEFDYKDQGVVTANELHVPVGRSIIVDTQSKDVIHSFWVPKLAGKIDAIPGKTNLVWFTPEKPGTYYGQCAEFCGTSHANMRFRVIVETEDEFSAWVARTKAPMVASTSDAKEGEKLFGLKGCNICHTISGRPDAVGVIGPNLTNLHDRTTIASALLDNTPENLAHWIKAPRELKPGALMCFPPATGPEAPCGPLPVNDQEIKQLIAYLMSPTAAAGKPAPARTALR